MDSVERRRESEYKWLLKEDREFVIRTLMETYHLELKHLAYSYMKDWGQAEDIVQDVFVICFKKLRTFKGESTIKTWLYRITINKCKDELKRFSNKKVTVGLPNTKKYDEQNKVETHLIQRDEQQQLAEAIMSLPVKYREVIILYYYNELKTKDIASTLKVNERTVRTRMRRARHMLKELVEEVAEHGRTED
ncbi:sigma-70 family RNA polymerase sigma factor [Bacillaceae bacterium W0354]